MYIKCIGSFSGIVTAQEMFIIIIITIIAILLRAKMKDEKILL